MGKKSSSTTKPSKYAKPYITAAGNAQQSAYNSALPAVQAAADLGGSVLNEQIPGLVAKANSSDPLLGKAGSYLSNVMGGGFLGQNPYTSQIINQTNNTAMNGTQAALGLRGLTGGSTYADLISKNLAENTSNILYGDYNAERDRMTQAASQAAGVSNAQTSATSAANQTLQSALALNAQLAQSPISAASQYAGGIGGLFSPYATTTQKQGIGSTLGQLAGAGLQAFAMASDRRLKTDIRRVGQTDGGLPVYTYRYKGSPLVHMGVMAQEVAEMQPWAVGENLNGFGTVRYAEVR